MRGVWILVAVIVVMNPSSAPAQSAPAKLIISKSAFADVPAAPAIAQNAQRRDSLKNGAIIGAIAGAAVFGGYVTFLCNALQEPSDPSCLGSSLLAIGIGAGGGAAAGAGIDALVQRSPGARALPILRKRW